MKDNKILAVLVNFGEEQLDYLQDVVNSLKSFKKYNVTVIVQSNIPLKIEGVDKVNIVKLEDYQLLPLTCRKEIWDRKDNYDVFLFGENDHLFKEHHIDKHIEYTSILPKNRITGLIQYEENEFGKYYPGYHNDFEWDYNSVEIYQGKVFAHFNNTHQATFILTRQQLIQVGRAFNFEKLVDEYAFIKRLKRKLKQYLGLPIKKPNRYSVKSKVNTDVYEYGGMKKVICISEFEDNLIHHLPNIYIDGLRGRNKFRSDATKMQDALNKLLNSL